MNDLYILYEEVFGEEELVTENKIKDKIINLSINKKIILGIALGGALVLFIKKIIDITEDNRENNSKLKKLLRETEHTISELKKYKKEITYTENDRKIIDKNIELLEKISINISKYAKTHKIDKNIYKSYLYKLSDIEYKLGNISNYKTKYKYDGNSIYSREKYKEYFDKLKTESISESVDEKRKNIKEIVKNMPIKRKISIAIAFCGLFLLMIRKVKSEIKSRKIHKKLELKQLEYTEKMIKDNIKILKSYRKNIFYRDAGISGELEKTIKESEKLYESFKKEIKKKKINFDTLIDIDRQISNLYKYIKDYHFYDNIVK